MKANLTEKIAVAVIRFFLNIIYKLCCLKKRKNLAIFITRQSDSPSYNFTEIANRINQNNIETQFLCTKLSRKNILKYAVHAIGTVNALARCKICYLERYDPIVSLIKFHNNDKNYKYPDKPIVVQLWHAFGAFKKFGYQCADTPEGHSSDVMKLYRIHKNYSYVLCSSKACQLPFAKAFNIEKSRVIPCPLPELDRLKSMNLKNKNQADKAGKADKASAQVLFAPSLRNDKNSPHPMRDMYLSGKWKNSLDSRQVLWSFHPLELKTDTLGSSCDLLFQSDILITDYSSLAYEAFLLNKKVLFYCPDIEEYRKSPGLNSDPKIICPDITFMNEADLFSFINLLLNDKVAYPYQALTDFCGLAFNLPSEMHCESSVEKLEKELFLR